MDHDLTRRPMAGLVATVAATAVILATTTSAPPRPPGALAAPPISTQAVHLTALTRSPQAAGVARASADLNIGDVVKVLPSSIVQALTPLLAGPAAGAFIGFFGAGILAINVLSNIPVVGQALAPLIPVVAIAGGLIGAPIGLVLGPILAIANSVARVVRLLNGTAAALASPASALNGKAATTPHHAARPAARSNRHIAKSSAPTTSKAAAPQQRSDTKRTVAGSARHAASRNTR